MKILLLILALLGASAAMAENELSSGQTLYLPIYSRIWHGDRVSDRKYPADSPLSALVSIRNTSLKSPVRIISARYYNTEGKLLGEYLPKPVVVNALGTLELFVERRESEGGSGANFIIQWDSAAPTNPPLVEAVHADIRGGVHAMAFVTTARALLNEK